MQLNKQQKYSHTMTIDRVAEDGSNYHSITMKSTFLIIFFNFFTHPLLLIFFLYSVHVFRPIQHMYTESSNILANKK